jgi:7,8-dihydropterin-6-yl-methyl-4-(beta-D-ribofuranosyl)aminobenzene 5'-phosphate synthase
MIQQLRVTTLVENSVYTRGLLAEHGLSFLVEADGRGVLFDTGQGNVILGNALRLGIQLDTLDAIVLSHGHDDHTGGLADVLRAAGGPRILLHPAALEAKYVRLEAPPHRAIGFPETCRHALESDARKSEWTRKPTEILPGLEATGEIPRTHDFEDVGGAFYLDESCQRPDPLVDDQALFADCEAGLVVILGCAHSGVINTLEYVTRLTGRNRVHAVLGGMHLINASRRRIEATADAFETYGVEKIAPCHCTGSKAVSYFQSRFGDRVVDCSTGTRFRFEKAAIDSDEPSSQAREQYSSVR